MLFIKRFLLLLLICTQNLNISAKCCEVGCCNVRGTNKGKENTRPKIKIEGYDEVPKDQISENKIAEINFSLIRELFCISINDLNNAQFFVNKKGKCLLVINGCLFQKIRNERYFSKISNTNLYFYSSEVINEGNARKIRISLVDSKNNIYRVSGITDDTKATKEKKIKKNTSGKGDKKDTHSKNKKSTKEVKNTNNRVSNNVPFGNKNLYLKDLKPDQIELVEKYFKAIEKRNNINEPFNLINYSKRSNKNDSNTKGSERNKIYENSKKDHKNSEKDYKNRETQIGREIFKEKYKENKNNNRIENSSKENEHSKRAKNNKGRKYGVFSEISTESRKYKNEIRWNKQKKKKKDNEEITKEDNEEKQEEDERNSENIEKLSTFIGKLSKEALKPYFGKLKDIVNNGKERESLLKALFNKKDESGKEALGFYFRKWKDIVKKEEEEIRKKNEKETIGKKEQDSGREEELCRIVIKNDVIQKESSEEKKNEDKEINEKEEKEKSSVEDKNENKEQGNESDDEWEEISEKKEVEEEKEEKENNEEKVDRPITIRTNRIILSKTCNKNNTWVKSVVKGNRLLKFFKKKLKFYFEKWKHIKENEEDVKEPNKKVIKEEEPNVIKEVWGKGVIKTEKNKDENKDGKEVEEKEKKDEDKEINEKEVTEEKTEEKNEEKNEEKTRKKKKNKKKKKRKEENNEEEKNEENNEEKKGEKDDEKKNVQYEEEKPLEEEEEKERKEKEEKNEKSNKRKRKNKRKSGNGKAIITEETSQNEDKEINEKEEKEEVTNEGKEEIVMKGDKEIENKEENKDENKEEKNEEENDEKKDEKEVEEEEEKDEDKEINNVKEVTEEKTEEKTRKKKKNKKKEENNEENNENFKNNEESNKNEIKTEKDEKIENKEEEKNEEKEKEDNKNVCDDDVFFKKVKSEIESKYPKLTGSVDVYFSDDKYHLTISCGGLIFESVPVILDYSVDIFMINFFVCIMYGNAQSDSYGFVEGEQYTLDQVLPLIEGFKVFDMDLYLKAYFYDISNNKIVAYINLSNYIPYYYSNEGCLINFTSFKNCSLGKSKYFIKAKLDEKGKEFKIDSVKNESNEDSDDFRVDKSIINFINFSFYIGTEKKEKKRKKKIETFLENIRETITKKNDLLSNVEVKFDEENRIEIKYNDNFTLKSKDPINNYNKNVLKSVFDVFLKTYNPKFGFYKFNNDKSLYYILSCIVTGIMPDEFPCLKVKIKNDKVTSYCYINLNDLFIYVPYNDDSISLLCDLENCNSFKLHYFFNNKTFKFNGKKTNNALGLKILKENKNRIAKNDLGQFTFECCQDILKADNH